MLKYKSGFNQDLLIKNLKDSCVYSEGSIQIKDDFLFRIAISGLTKLYYSYSEIKEILEGK